MAKSFDPKPDSAAMPLADLPAAVQKVDEPVRPNARRRLAPIELNLPIKLSPAVSFPGYAPRCIDDVTLNTLSQRVSLKLLTDSLIGHRAELNDGTRVTRPQHAIQWLLDQIAIGLPSEVLEQLMEEVQ